MRRWLEMGRFMQETGWLEGWLVGKKDSLHDVMRENKRKETAVAQLVQTQRAFPLIAGTVEHDFWTRVGSRGHAWLGHVCRGTRAVLLGGLRVTSVARR